MNAKTVSLTVLAALCLLPIACPSWGQKQASQTATSTAAAATPPIQPGHSLHGSAFDEGPRQRAKLMRGYGTVHFPITTSNPEAQRFFDQGINQLYSFFYFEAERSFRTAAMLDPDCAMAYWGLARSDHSDRRKAFLTLAQQKMAKATDRERRYIEAECIGEGLPRFDGTLSKSSLVTVP